MFASIIVAAIVISGVPAWIPIIRGKPCPPLLRRGLALIAASQAALVVFVLGVFSHLFALDYSLCFAAIGLPLCVWGGTLAIKSIIRDHLGVGSLFTVVLTIAWWLFMITWH